MYDAEALIESVLGQEPSVRRIVIEAFLAGISAFADTDSLKQYDVELAFYKWYFEWA